MKRVVKLLISLAVHGVDRVRESLLHLLGRPAPGSCVVIYYHGIRPDLREGFARQMDLVARLTTVLPTTHADTLAPGRRYCMITFDDGFITYLEQALPEMEKRSLPSTNFIPTGSLGSPPRWIKRADHPAMSESVMSTDQLKRLATHPLLTLGSHSVNHPDFLSLTPADASKELTESRMALESLLCRPITTFSFPHGRFNAAVLQQAQEAGYTRLFGIQPRPAIGHTQDALLGRVAVEPDDWPLEFRLKLLGAYRWMARGH